MKINQQQPSLMNQVLELQPVIRDKEEGLGRSSPQSMTTVSSKGRFDDKVVEPNSGLIQSGLM